MDWAWICQIFGKKNYRLDFGKKKGQWKDWNDDSVKFENLEEMSKWTRLFSVNGLGLNFCGIFEEKNYRSALGKIGNSQKQWKD